MHDVPETLQRLSKLANPATWFSRKPPPSRAILQRLTGTIRQGEMLMVVGRPGSGCTTVLKALANIRDEYLAMEGDVWYGPMDAGTVSQTRANQVAFVGKRTAAPSMQSCTVLKRRMETLQERTTSTSQHYQSAPRSSLLSIPAVQPPTRIAPNTSNKTYRLCLNSWDWIM